MLCSAPHSVHFQTCVPGCRLVNFGGLCSREKHGGGMCLMNGIPSPNFHGTKTDLLADPPPKPLNAYRFGIRVSLRDKPMLADIEPGRVLFYCILAFAVGCLLTAVYYHRRGN